MPPRKALKVSGSLRRGGHIFKVVKETLLTDAFALEPGAEGTALKAGEVLEMYDVPKVDDVSKSTRMRVKAPLEYRLPPSAPRR